jgi:Na+/melibiose symporter-like transporter
MVVNDREIIRKIWRFLIRIIIIVIVLVITIILINLYVEDQEVKSGATSMITWMIISMIISAFFLVALSIVTHLYRNPEVKVVDDIDLNHNILFKKSTDRDYIGVKVTNSSISDKGIERINENVGVTHKLYNSNTGEYITKTPITVPQ